MWKFRADILCPVHKNRDKSEQNKCELKSVQLCGTRAAAPAALRPPHAASSAPALMVWRAWARDVTALPYRDSASPLLSRRRRSNSALRRGRRRAEPYAAAARCCSSTVPVAKAHSISLISTILFDKITFIYIWFLRYVNNVKSINRELSWANPNQPGVIVTVSSLHCDVFLCMCIVQSPTFPAQNLGDHDSEEFCKKSWTDSAYFDRLITCYNPGSIRCRNIFGQKRMLTWFTLTQITCLCWWIQSIWSFCVVGSHWFKVFGQFGQDLQQLYTRLPLMY